MKITVLASGSKGNCTYIEGDSGALLIDAGLSAKEILKRLDEAGGSQDLIRGILLTHEHSDHMKGIDVLARKLNVPVYATQGTLWQFEEKRRSDAPVELNPCKKNETVTIDGFNISSFSTYHDACDPCGFSIGENGMKVTYCTDTGRICGRMLENLKNSDYIILESNHCPRMLENGPYPRFLKERIRDQNRGHLSNSLASGCLRDIKNEIGGVICDGCVTLNVALQHEISVTIRL